MKWILLISALYLLLLPCIPCSDTNDCSSAALTGLPGVSALSQEHSQDEEACSPLCNCTCCGHIFTHILRPAGVALTGHYGNDKEYRSYHNISLSANYFGNIWQPPKYS